MDEGVKTLNPILVVFLCLLLVVVCDGCAYFKLGPSYSAEESMRGGIKLSDNTAGVIGGTGEILNSVLPLIH